MDTTVSHNSGGDEAEKAWAVGGEHVRCDVIDIGVEDLAGIAAVLVDEALKCRHDRFRRVRVIQRGVGEAQTRADVFEDQSRQVRVVLVHTVRWSGLANDVVSQIRIVAEHGFSWVCVELSP